MPHFSHFSFSANPKRSAKRPREEEREMSRAEVEEIVGDILARHSEATRAREASLMAAISEEIGGVRTACEAAVGRVEARVSAQDERLDELEAQVGRMEEALRRHGEELRATHDRLGGLEGRELARARSRQFDSLIKQIPDLFQGSQRGAVYLMVGGTQEAIQTHNRFTLRAEMKICEKRREGYHGTVTETPVMCSLGGVTQLDGGVRVYLVITEGPERVAKSPNQLAVEVNRVALTLESTHHSGETYWVAVKDAKAIKRTAAYVANGVDTANVLFDPVELANAPCLGVSL